MADFNYFSSESLLRFSKTNDGEKRNNHYSDIITTPAANIKTSYFILLEGIFCLFIFLHARIPNSFKSPCKLC